MKEITVSYPCVGSVHECDDARDLEFIREKGMVKSPIADWLESA